MPIVTQDERPPGPGRFPLTEKRMLLDEGTTSSPVSMGELVLHPGAYVPPHRHDVEEAFYVVAGHPTCMTGDEVCRAAPGDAVLAPAGALHSLRNETAEDVKLVYFYPVAAKAQDLGISADYPESTADVDS
ncbi:cupin domain-containing protein [Kribbella sp. NPDC051620]|uniref:cupin domain-containing protein n=1 Tax=Kribbella sp. NPDC051620 TaxID=3364120 RepID=UPI00378AA8F8